MKRVSIERTIYLADTDATGFAYYARYFEWMESARMDMLRSAGGSIDLLRAEGITAVVRETACRYTAPLKLGDAVDVECWVSHIGKTSLAIDYQFSNKTTGAPAGNGSVVVVFITINSGRPTKIPPSIRAGIEPFSTIANANGGNTDPSSAQGFNE